MYMCIPSLFSFGMVRWTIVAHSFTRSLLSRACLCLQLCWQNLQRHPAHQCRSVATPVASGKSKGWCTFQASFSNGMSVERRWTFSSMQRGAFKPRKSMTGEDLTIRVVHLRVQRNAVLVAACRRPSLWGWRSCSTCVLQNPGRGWGWGWWGGWGWRYGVDHSHLWLLLFEGRRPRGASLWHCGMVTLRQHYLDAGLSWGWGSTAAHSLLIRGQSHLDTFNHDRHRLAGHSLITSRHGEPDLLILWLVCPI